MAVSLAAQAPIKLDPEVSKYPSNAKGARRLVRRAGRRQLARDIARGEA